MTPEEIRLKALDYAVEFNNRDLSDIGNYKKTSASEIIKDAEVFYKFIQNEEIRIIPSFVLLKKIRVRIVNQCLGSFQALLFSLSAYCLFLGFFSWIFHQKFGHFNNGLKAKIVQFCFLIAHRFFPFFMSDVKKAAQDSQKS